MASTYTQLHNHIVFATKYRAGSILPSWNNDLHKYITGIVQNHDHKMLQINNMPDHIHMLLGMKPHQSLSSLLRIVKSDSTRWIKENRLVSEFAWQEGYGAFSVSKSQLPKVMLYIQNQHEHHRIKSFQEEYVQMLTQAGIDFDPQYVFKSPV
jgi:putative transposase